jgi:citrate synthase
MANPDVIKTRLWSETAAAADEFVANACLAAGYDVYGDLLGQVSWTEYLYLLFRCEPPSPEQRQLLNHIAVALACLGPRDPSIQAAMTAAAAGSTAASSLVAAVAAGAGQMNGARDVHDLMLAWQQAGNSLARWRTQVLQIEGAAQTIWPQRSHPPGFDPNAGICGKPLIQTLALLSRISGAEYLRWLHGEREAIQAAAGMPIAFSAIAAGAFLDLGLDAQQGEMLYLLLRLPGAAALAVEQHQRGWKAFPFFRDKLVLTADPLQG